MQLFRPYYIDNIYNILEDKETKLILLHGWRLSGKTTILKHLVSDINIQSKKYYFSFEEEIVAKKFKNADDFRWYMQIKYGINFAEHNLLLLNEIQYSKNILSVFQQLLKDKNFNTRIIATGIIQSYSEQYLELIQSGQTKTITIHPLWFFDFLDYKGIHTTYLSIEKPSAVMFKELQGLFDEYLTRWWYPEVIKANTRDRKQQTLKSIVQKVYDKDVWFYFNGDEILVFQDLMEHLCHTIMTWCKYKTISQETEIPIPLIKKYLHFLTDNCLINTIPYFFTNKKRELSHQQTIVIEDMGIKSYMTQNFWSKLHDIISIKNFIYWEIAKNTTQEDICMTYQKVNNSTIDFIIEHQDNTYTVIVVSDSNSNKPPKIFKSFHETYWNKVRKYIKTTSLTAQKNTYNNKEFICVPHFMIKIALWY